MVQKSERQADILRLVETLDITPTMYKNAEEKYMALASFLEEHGIEAEIYPQGSFALGTVVRPSAKDPNAAYDLDFICKVPQTRDQISPSALRQKIEDTLKSDKRYADRLKKCGECFTVEYADIGEVGFSIDVVPATDESSTRKLELQRRSARPDLIETAIAIPRENGDNNYRWLTNNPRGFRTWFDEINRPFLKLVRDEQRQRIFKANRHVFASVDKIPEGLVRSAMQRVIQILKYHRDCYYIHLENGDDIKPISAIINTLVADIAKSADSKLSVYELLEYVLNELCIYANRQTMKNNVFTENYGARSVISKAEDTGDWRIPNPANPEDNLADKWNQNAQIPQVFFKWIAICKNDLIGSLSKEDSEFRVITENAFGAAIVQKTWADKYKYNPIIVPRQITKTSKPYREW